jgi:lysophospholipid acyltransferase (LPLAT)-like uncharacterized protein
MLISMHRDGELIARAIGYFDMARCAGRGEAGSNKKGRRRGPRGMLKALKASEYVGSRSTVRASLRATDGIVIVSRVGRADHSVQL